jgi:Acyclic terpene utilisation family protein AtuA
MVIKIGNAQGFWGDSPSAPARLVAQQPDLDYLTLDYLSEVSLSIMAIQQEKDPTLGYAKDFLEVIRSLIPFWKKGLNVKVIANAGGLNPLGCAQACKEICKDLKIGVVSGDNVLERLKTDPKNPLFANLDTKESLSQVVSRLVTANAYLGAKSIAEALRQGAQIVITGRIADPSLTVGPCVAHYQWGWTDWNRLAGATIAGHLIECGTQATGGVSTDWLSLEDPAHLGFPVVEVFSDGSCIMTKPPGTAGKVTQETVKEQLLYEIGDPDNYLSPDVTVSFLSLKLTDQGSNRIRIEGALGKPPPETYKVSATYRDGFKAEGLLAIFGQDAYKKARRCGEIILQRVRDVGYVPERFNIECLGGGDVVPGVFTERQKNLLECVLRVSIADQRREVVECFTKEIAPLVTSGPQGVTGYTSGRPSIRPVFGYWPCLINKSDVSLVNSINLLI